MRVGNAWLFRILKLCCLLLLCISFSGCFFIFGPSGCGHPPEVDPPNTLIIRQRENYFFPAYGEKVCYDDFAIYYLSGVETHMQLCRVEPQREPVVLHTFDTPVYEVACWKDAILVYGELPEQEGKKQENHGIYVFRKDDPAAAYVMIPCNVQQRQVVIDGVTKDMEIDMLPLRAVFNQETEHEPFDNLLAACYPQWMAEVALAEKQKSLLAFFGFPVRKEYHVSSSHLDQIWMLYEDSFAIYGRTIDGRFDVHGYCRLDSEARMGNTPYEVSYLFFYQGMPYAVDVASNNVEIIPCHELGKSTYVMEYEEKQELVKRYSGQDGRLQYLVIPRYRVVWDRYDAATTANHKIIALDMDTMQQTKELTLAAPREQVLYVSEAGAYTWRHDEGRIFLTDWQGQSKPVSDIIPYVLRYETEEDEKQNDACNTWYAEIDRERGRLLLFDMTLGETKLLAVVPVE